MKEKKVPSAISFTTPKEVKDSGYMTSAESIIYGSYVKMERLNPIVFDCFSNTSIATATHLNVFIDLYSVLHSIFSSKYRTQVPNPTVITPALINMCAHYRSFFKSLGVHTTFYIIYSANTCDMNEKFVFGYNAKFKEKTNINMFKKITNDNFELLKVLCPYLPDIHFIRSFRNYEVAVIIADIIEKLKDGQPNLIISKDLYPLQLCYLYPYTSYLYPRKSRIGGDMSIMVPIIEKTEEFRYQFWNIVAERRSIKPNSLYTISPLNFTMFSALHRFPEREIYPLVKTASEAVKIIQMVVGSQDISVFPSQLYNIQEIAELVPISLVEARYKALDVKFMLPFYQEDIESKEMKFENLQDNGTINMINSKYFKENPIDTMRL